MSDTKTTMREESLQVPEPKPVGRLEAEIIILRSALQRLLDAAEKVDNALELTTALEQARDALDG